MEKLSAFFRDKRNNESEHPPIEKIEESFPELTPEEEKEIFEKLGLNPATQPQQPQQRRRVRDVVVGTLRSLKQVKVEEAHEAQPSTSNDSNNQDMEDLGTVRIALADGGSKWGTLRRRKQNPAEIVLQELPSDAVAVLSSEESDSNSEQTSTDAEHHQAAPFHAQADRSASPPPLSGEDDEEEMYSSVRIKDTSVLDSLEQEYGTMRIKSDSSSNASSESEIPLWMNSSKKAEEEPQKFKWRQPEDWELAIIALERGEFDAANMKEDAFRKYKKERPKLANLSSTFFVVEPVTSPPMVIPAGSDKKKQRRTKSTDKTKKRENSHEDLSKKDKDKKDKKDKKSSSASSVAHAKQRNELSNSGDHHHHIAGTTATATATPSSPGKATGTTPEKKERKWAAFKRSSDARTSAALNNQ